MIKGFNFHLWNILRKLVQFRFGEYTKIEGLYKSEIIQIILILTELKIVHSPINYFTGSFEGRKKISALPSQEFISK